MKKWMFAAAAAALLSASCGKEEPFEVPEGKTGYAGPLEVVYQGETYTTEDVSVTLDYDAAAGTVDIYMYQVRFVPQMPVVIDIMIPSVPVAVSGGTVSFAGEDIVPQMVGAGGALTPVPNYTVTGLSGTFDEDAVAFSLLFGAFPTSYRGLAD